MTPTQCRMARGGLSWGMRDLARKAKVSPDTVARFERGERLRPKTEAKMRAALEKAGVEFINGKRPGVRLAAPLIGQPLDMKY